MQQKASQRCHAPRQVPVPGLRGRPAPAVSGSASSVRKPAGQRQRCARAGGRRRGERRLSPAPRATTRTTPTAIATGSTGKEPDDRPPVGEGLPGGGDDVGGGEDDEVGGGDPVPI